jgi:hypothetical protein
MFRSLNGYHQVTIHIELQGKKLRGLSPRANYTDRTTAVVIEVTANFKYGSGDLLRSPRDTLYPQKLALTSLTSSGLSVDIVRSRTEATEFVLVCFALHATDTLLMSLTSYLNR